MYTCCGNYNILTIINALNNVVNPFMDAAATTLSIMKLKCFFSSSNQIYLNGNKGALHRSLALIHIHYYQAIII
jgi:hypothetical protein